MNVTFVVSLMKTCVEYATSQLLKRISEFVVLTKRHKNIAETSLWRGVYAVKILGYLVEIYTKYFHTFDNRAFSGLGDRYVKEGPIRRGFKKNKKQMC